MARVPGVLLQDMEADPRQRRRVGVEPPSGHRLLVEPPIGPQTGGLLGALSQPVDKRIEVDVIGYVPGAVLLVAPRRILVFSEMPPDEPASLHVHEVCEQPDRGPARWQS